MAVMDTPTTWFITQGSATSANWNAKPVTDGYGLNPAKDATGVQSNTLKNLSSSVGSPSYTLNVNTTSPDSQTVFDTPLAWVAIAYIANRGTGLSNVDMSDLQYLFVTGRTKSGANLAAVTRDSGSGTRNAAMNSIGVDPSWGCGDNVGVKNNDVVALGSLIGKLGPQHQVSNCDGTSTVAVGVQARRLGIGYVGLTGTADVGANAGKYDILNIRKDIAGGTQYVRPTLSAVLYNSDVNTGWQIGGAETYATVGDPFAATTGNPPMQNQAAAAYLRNTIQSIAAFAGDPGSDASYNMPGEYLAYNFLLQQAMDAVPQASPVDPITFVPNPELNLALQDVTASYNSTATPAGNVTPAGLVPARTPNPDFDGDGVVDSYSDGSVNGSYTDAFGQIVQVDKKLARRNAVAGDFNNDGVRDYTDAAKMMEAVAAPRSFEANQSFAGDKGDQTNNCVIVEVIGDFNGDGNFDSEDIRYFADGLATDPTTGNLNRQEGFTRVDTAFGGNYFNTTLATGKAYAAGDSCGDVYKAMTSVSKSITAVDVFARTFTVSGDLSMAAWPEKVVVAGNTGSPSNNGTYQVVGVKKVGSNTVVKVLNAPKSGVAGGTMTWTPIVAPGAEPKGFDGVVDMQDLLWVKKNLGDWSDLTVASRIDLSCDMNGDLLVDGEDGRVVVEDILGTRLGDMNLDGSVDVVDLLIFVANFGVDQESLGAAWFSVPAGGTEGDIPCVSDLNCDGWVDVVDLLMFVENFGFSM
jgi:hypothetical protein